MPNADSTQQERSAAAIRGYILFFFLIILALAVAWRVRSVLEVIYVSSLFAVILTPAVTRITNLHLPRGRRFSQLTAIVLLVSTVFLGLGLFFFFALPPVIHDARQFAEDLPKRIPSIVARLRRLPMADKLGVDAVAKRTEDAASATAGYLFSNFPTWAERIFNVITAFILCIYFMLEGDSAYRWFLSLFKEDNRIRIHRTFAHAESRMSRWLIGQATLMLTLGVTSTIAFYFIGVRYFVLLGVLMGLFNIIPIAGGLITILIAAGVAALDSWTKMGLVFAFYVVYINVENAILIPRIMRNHVNLMGLTIFVSLLLGTALAGIVGALVAIPTAVLVSCFLNEFFVEDKKLLADQTDEPAC